MRHKFPGYFPPSETTLNKLWTEGIIVPDANVLLGLYRYSDPGRKEVINVLTDLGDRLWVPHQAAKEIVRNRLTALDGHIKFRREASDLISKTIKQFDDRKHPSMPTELHKQLMTALRAAAEHFQKTALPPEQVLKSDPIFPEIERLIGSRIGDPFDTKAIEGIYKDGAERYSRFTPPGYEDTKKPALCDEEPKYGDLVLWKQMIARATAEKKGMIFVTEDSKEDWWLLWHDAIQGPRPELIREFTEATGQQIHFYQPHQFIELAKQRIGAKVHLTTIAEARNQSKERARSAIATRRSGMRTDEYHLAVERVMAHIAGVNERLDAFERRRHLLMHRRVDAEAGDAPKAVKNEIEAELSAIDCEVARLRMDRDSTRQQMIVLRELMIAPAAEKFDTLDPFSDK